MILDSTEDVSDFEDVMSDGLAELLRGKVGCV